MMRVLLAVGLLVGGLLPSPTAGQELDAVDRSILDGRTAEARDLLLEWWDGGWEEADRPERERALWLRGRLTLDPREAASSYRRMVTEYPVGRWTGEALRRLGSLALAAGDTASAARWFTILERDFRGTDSARGTADWLAAEAASIERARNAPPPPSAARTPPARADLGDWTIQLGAFAARGRATSFAEDVRGAGFSPRVVQVEGSDLWRVRIGRFLDDSDARALYDRVRGAGFDAAIVPGADNERAGG